LGHTHTRTHAHMHARRHAHTHARTHACTHARTHAPLEVGDGGAVSEDRHHHLAAGVLGGEVQRESAAEAQDGPLLRHGPVDQVAAAVGDQPLVRDLLRHITHLQKELK
jgi:hypothetical protein